MSILLDVRCVNHPRYNAKQYPRVLKWDGRCPWCVELWRLKHNAVPGIKTITSGTNP